MNRKSNTRFYIKKIQNKNVKKSLQLWWILNAERRSILRFVIAFF